jgi:hypothetical protein
MSNSDNSKDKLDLESLNSPGKESNSDSEIFLDEENISISNYSSQDDIDFDESGKVH